MLCVFDVNETLLDLGSMDAVVGGAELRREWFGLAIHTVLAVTATGGYRDFAGIAGDAAIEVAARHGREVDLAAVAAGLRSMPAHPDVEPGLTRLREAGHTVVALTNSPLATAEAQLQNAGLAPLLDRIFSAEQVGRLKPAPEPYRQVVAAYPGQRAVMIAAHDWDIAGAQAAGLETALLTRPGVHPLPGSPAPTYTAPTLPELAALL